MADKLKVSAPDDCGNAPRKVILKNFNIAFVTKNEGELLDFIADQIVWNIVGDEVVEGKEQFMRKLDDLHQDEVTELELYKVITHGYEAAAHGKVTGTSRSYDFCHVYRFAGASKTAKIREITSYII